MRGPHKKVARPAEKSCPLSPAFQTGYALDLAYSAGVTRTGWIKVAKIPPGVGPQHSQVVVLVGATGDLSRRKLLPGLFYLSSAGFIPGCRIIGVSLDQIDADGFRKIAREALDQFSCRKVKDADWAAFAETLDYVPIGAGPHALKAAVEAAERKLVVCTI
jgi:glucose-6-phosphate 1-dehydrogenase